MPDIFLSYAREDGVFARALADALEEHGLSVFIDRDIPAGEDFARFIEARLDEAGCAVVIWSRASVESSWVFAEAMKARERHALVPVFAEAAPPPFPLQMLQAIDLSRWDHRADDARIAKLVADVGRLVGPGVDASPSVDLGGIWRGEWASIKSGRPHLASLHIPAKHGLDFEASLVVTYEWRDETTVIHEIMSGSLSGTHLLLRGQAHDYLLQGQSRRYSLDSFDLGVETPGPALAGVFKKGDEVSSAEFRLTGNRLGR